MFHVIKGHTRGVADVNNDHGGDITYANFMLTRTEFNLAFLVWRIFWHFLFVNVYTRVGYEVRNWITNILKHKYSKHLHSGLSSPK
jgi:hypothetical protein